MNIRTLSFTFGTNGFTFEVSESLINVLLLNWLGNKSRAYSCLIL